MLNRTARRGVALAATLAVAFAAPVNADAASKSRVTQQRTGQVAIDFLGNRIDKAAKSAHLTPAKLKETLRHDKTLKVDDNGQLLYVEPQHSGTSTITDSVTTPVYATSSTFALHSRSSSPMKIYLDFNGHTTSGTRWNTNFKSGAAFSTPAFDRDGYPGSFSSYEHAIIQAVWLSVREDFAPFNVDVTTQDPGYEGLRYSGSGDTAYGVRVVIGPNTWYPYSAGGVGYLDTFGNSDTPVYVFTNTSSGAKFISEASSHETGHAFGLSHDGTTAGVQYYAGHGTWAPIMGTSYGRPVSQWSRGEYAGANNTQDDLGLIARYTGWSADEYAGNTSTTGTLPAGTARYAAVNWTGDVDGYKFSLTGSRRLTINTWHNTGPVDPNVNMRMTLRNSAGTVIATSSPAGDLRTSMTVTLGAGTYYVYVDGVGEGSAYNTGWSSYASNGYYGIWLNWA
ncbi:MAG TPA: pre-peptidase C-terminal domain-containing protein [Nocardioidaceae bacterium]|nr:pre-peptidase C-terminal domain-containing protein [Nocardioidaceae bacterium]